MNIIVIIIVIVILTILLVVVILYVRFECPRKAVDALVQSVEQPWGLLKG